MPAPPSRIRRIFDLAAQLPPESVIHTTNQLQLIEAQARFPEEDLPEFIGWDELNRALPELFTAYWLPFTEDRRRSMEAIDDWTLSPAFCDIYTAAMVDPIDRACRSEIARQWLLLCNLHVNCGIPVPHGHHVIGESMILLERGNSLADLPNQFKTILARANYVSLQGIVGIGPGMCPPQGEQGDSFLRERIGVLRAVVRGVVGCLMDDSLPKRAEFFT